MNLKQLAHSLGLSQTTVSRALNGYPEVSEQTRARVLRAAERHDYRPNLRAKSLATGRAMAIGHVLPISTQHEIVNPIFSDFIAGAGEVYARKGYSMVLSVVEDGDEAAVYRNLYARGAVDGVVLHAPTGDDPRIALLRDIGLPFVVHGRASDVAAPYCWLDVNNRSAFRQATDFLIDLGHRRIGLINGRERLDFAARRRSGYREAMAVAGLDIDPALMFAGEMTERMGFRAMAAMLRLPHPPSAVVVSSIISAIGARRAIDERGLGLGRGVSVVTHDDVLSYMANSGDVPMFTATRSPVREAGRRVAELLMERIADPDAPPGGQLLQAELVVGQSTGPALTSLSA